MAYRALLRECKEKFLKITTLVDTRNSKNSKRILFIALELFFVQRLAFCSNLIL